MINSVGTSGAATVQPSAPEPKTNALAEKRAEEGHKLVVSGLQEQHKQRLEAAIEAHVRFELGRSAEATNALSHVQKAYSEF